MVTIFRSLCPQLPIGSVKLIVVELIGGSVTIRGPIRNPKAFPPSRRNQERPSDKIENVVKK